MGPEAPTGRIWLWGALLYAWFYLSFSAWSDVAIGVGALCGRRVQENFAYPWAAIDPADFWRRYNRPAQEFFREDVFRPLGGPRRPIRVALATFLVSALLVASVREGWGLVVTEAAACGTPSIVYDVPGLRDAVRHEVTGLVVPPTPADLAAAMRRIIQERALAQRLGAAALELSKTFNYDRSAEVLRQGIRARLS